MGVQVTGASALHWYRQLSPDADTDSAAGLSFASVFASICSKKFAPIHAGGERESLFLGAASTSLFRTQSFEAVASMTTTKRRMRASLRRTLRRASSASLDCFNGDEDDARMIQEWQQRLRKQQREDEADPWAPPSIHPIRIMCGATASSSSISSFSSIPIPPPVRPPVSPGGTHEPIIEPLSPAWYGEIVPAVVEKNANRVGLPLSLRIIKEKKKRREDGIWEDVAGDSGAWLCSVKKAFSSMVFIIRELVSYALKLRQALFYEDLQGVLKRVQSEMSSSFVWLFQQIFSCTPTLMISVMLLLANFTLYSIGHGAAIATPATTNPPSRASTTALDIQQEDHHVGGSRFDHEVVKTVSIDGRAVSVGGSGGTGGGKTKPVSGATDDGLPGGFSRSSFRTVLPDPGAVDSDGEAGKDHENARTAEEAAVEEEARKWKEVLDTAHRMKASAMDEALLDSEVRRRFVSPVTVQLEPEDYSTYSRTELMYQQAVHQDPDNVLLLSNYAQFLFLVLRNHDRAEYYFKRAVAVQPADAEVLSQYASFLWLGKKDLMAAAETYLEAIAADPGNTAHATNYAHYLWNTGGEETCFPLDGDDA